MRYYTTNATAQAFQILLQMWEKYIKRRQKDAYRLLKIIYENIDKNCSFLMVSFGVMALASNSIQRFDPVCIHMYPSLP
jgi:hypothetical protein